MSLFKCRTPCISSFVRTYFTISLDSCLYNWYLPMHELWYHANHCLSIIALQICINVDLIIFQLWFLDQGQIWINTFSDPKRNVWSKTLKEWRVRLNVVMELSGVVVLRVENPDKDWTLKMVSEGLCTPICVTRKREGHSASLVNQEMKNKTTHWYSMTIIIKTIYVLVGMWRN